MAMIDVRKHYIGLDSQNNMIYPGLYAVGDPLLYGLERDLIDIGYAVMVEAADAPPAPEDAPPAPEDEQSADATQFEAMTVAELKALADAHNVDLAGLRSKSDIIASLVADGVKPPAPEGGNQEAVQP